jgi:hypothetical protein
VCMSAVVELYVDLDCCGFVVCLMGKAVQEKMCVDVGCRGASCRSRLLWIRGLLDEEGGTGEDVRRCRLLWSFM